MARCPRAMLLNCRPQETIRQKMPDDCTRLIATERNNGTLVLTVATHEISDIAAVASLERQLRHCAGERAEIRWVIDFGNVTFFITPAINALLEIARGLRTRGGDIVLTGLSADVRYVLGLRAVDQVLTIVPTVTEALAVLHNGNNHRSGAANGTSG